VSNTLIPITERTTGFACRPFCYYKDVKKILSTLCLLCVAGFAQAAVLSEPDNSFILLDIDEPAAAQTYYGQLDNFPHTYQFLVGESFNFSAYVAGTGKNESEIDLSLILVKKVKRGVVEIDRKSSDDISWTTDYNAALGMSLVEGETLSATLEEGVYILEVSTPENNAPYQLVINGGDSVSYRELFMARSVFDESYLGILLTWRIFVPLLFIGGVWIYIRKKKHA